jgi:hypothetical protein
MTARKRTALGNERTLQALNQEIEKSVAIGPSVDIDETGHGGAFHGTVDLGKAHLERSSQFRVGWSCLRRGKCKLHRDDDILWPHRHGFIIVSRFAKCKTTYTGGVLSGDPVKPSPQSVEDALARAVTAQLARKRLNERLVGQESRDLPAEVVPI